MSGNVVKGGKGVSLDGWVRIGWPDCHLPLSETEANWMGGKAGGSSSSHNHTPNSEHGNRRYGSSGYIFAFPYCEAGL